MLKITIPYEQRRQQPKWRMLTLHLRSYQMGQRLPQTTSLYNSIWCLTLKWRTSIVGLHCGKRPHDQSNSNYHICQCGCQRVKIIMMIPDLNDLEVKSADILNAYEQAPVMEKVLSMLGHGFVNDVHKVVGILKALYGLISAGAAFRSHLASCMESMGYLPCQTDPDLWMRHKTHPDNMVKQYLYLLCYLDGILCFHHNVDIVLQHLHKSLPLKPGYGNSHMYLDAKLNETKLYNRIWA